MWSESDIPDQTGRVAVVTGANGGLGLATGTALARAGAHVIAASRNQEKAARARDQVAEQVPGATWTDVPIDLGSQHSVDAAAAAILDTTDRVDILVNNAGVMAMPEGTTEDGHEFQLGVNHLGHWVLTARLLPAIVAAQAGRVVSLSSIAHHQGRILDPENPHLKGRYGPWRAYGQSKLANLHFAIGLQRAFEDTAAPARSLAAHPGLTNSDLQATTVQENDSPVARLFHWMTRTMGMSPPRGALSQLRAATDPSAQGGAFYGPVAVLGGAPVRKPLLRRWDLERGVERLWQVSRRETGVAMDVAGAMAARS